MYRLSTTNYMVIRMGCGYGDTVWGPKGPPNPRSPRVIERVAFDGKGVRLAAAYAEGEFSIWDTSALLQ